MIRLILVIVGLVVFELAANAAEPDMQITTFKEPAFQQWERDVAKLPAEKQVEAVIKKLQELNPGFDGEVNHRIEDGVVTGLYFRTDDISDISPVRALVDLYSLWCNGTYEKGKGKLSDLSPLKGMSLRTLLISTNQVSDLSPLRGMPLIRLWCNSTNVSDLSPLKRMSLKQLYCQDTRVADLSPLIGMSLTNVSCDNTAISDLSPLKGMPLRYLSCNDTRVADLSPLKACTPQVVIEVTDTRVTAATVADMRKAIPTCTILWTAPDDPPKK